MRNFLHALLRSPLILSQRAATAVEYGLIIALIVLAIMSALQLFASKTNAMWYNVANEVVKN